MMILRSPALRTLTILGRRAFSNVSIQKGLHDPSRHITMNHFPHTQYIDYWPLGQYPETYVIGSVSPTVYQSKAQKILVDAINAKYKKTSFELREILDQNFNKLFSTTLKDAEGKQLFIAQILSKLSYGIIVRESRWTWVKQQQYRASFAADFLAQQDFSNFREFLAAYNTVIERTVQISHFGLAGKIEHEPSAQQKHLYEQINDQPTGIKDLQDTSRVQNENFINRIMRAIHSQ